MPPPQIQVCILSIITGMFINYFEAATALVYIPVAMEGLHYSLDALLCMVFSEVFFAVDPWSTWRVSRALSISLGSIGREGYSLIWMDCLFMGWWWYLKCCCPPSRRWKWVPEFAQANDICVPMPWWWERWALGFDCVSILSVPLLPVLCFFSHSLEVEMLGK